MSVAFGYVGFFLKKPLRKGVACLLYFWFV